MTLDEQIALVNERVGLMGERIDYTSNRRWTNYLTTDPLRLVANIFGGGDVQRDVRCVWREIAQNLTR